MRDLHYLPRFADRWSHLYLEHGTVSCDDNSIVFYDKDGQTPVPIDQFAMLFLGPGIKLTQQAMRLLAENNCLVCWTGEEGVRMYAHSTGATHSAHRMLRQADLYCNPAERLKVACRMYQKRFPEQLGNNLSIERLRGMEGARVRDSYRRIAADVGIQWRGRSYDQDHWDNSDPVNRALSAANACLYGLCHAGILSAGYSPAIGFIHVGKMLSFVYDIADLYKTEITLPIAFRTAAASSQDVERRVRLLCRDMFYETGLMERILPDIAEVLDAGDDAGERPNELEGRAVALAGGTESRSFYRQPERESEGPIVDPGVAEGENGLGDADLEPPESPGL